VTPVPSIAVVGLGRIGRLHAANLASRIESGRLVCVVDVSEAAARAAGDEHDVRWSTRYEDALADPHVTGVVIATPTPAHATMVAQAAAAKKHVFCEKPLGLEERAIRETIATADAAGILLQVGFHRRFDPDLQETRRQIEAGCVGEIALFQSSFREPLSPPGEYLVESGDFFADTVIHDLDLARWLIGEVTAIGADLAVSTPASQGVESAVVALRFASGALGAITASMGGGCGYHMAVEVVGSRASIRAGTQHIVRDLQWIERERAYIQLDGDFTSRFACAYRAEIAHFCASLRDEQPPAVSGHDALVASVMCDHAARSARDCSGFLTIGST
jgi:predicted dehydrogenase